MREDDRSIDRLTRVVDQVLEMIRDDWKRQDRRDLEKDRVLEEVRLSNREIAFQLDALRTNDIVPITDCLRVMRADAEKAALELDRATLDKLRKQKWKQEQENGNGSAIGKPEDFNDGVTASGRGLKMVITWGVLWRYGKWIAAGGGGWLVHYVQHVLHLAGH